jgi:hypothetical protein
MTWGETATRNSKFNGQHEKKVAARALTSNDLLGTPFQYFTEALNYLKGVRN